LTLHADHELNASTFAGRVAAATLTDIYSVVVAAIGALKGPLHGGANADVILLLLELGQDATADRVDQAILAPDTAERLPVRAAGGPLVASAVRATADEQQRAAERHRQRAQERLFGA
jgi:hypothetical protein